MSPELEPQNRYTESVLILVLVSKAVQPLRIRNPQAAPSAANKALGTHYPDRFSLIYDVCLVQGLIREQEDGLKLTNKGVQVLQEPESLGMVPVYRTWMRIYKYPIPLLPVLSHLIGLLCDRWVVTSSLLDVLRPWLNSYYYDSPEQVFERRIIKMMVHLGMLQMTATPDGTAARLSAAGRRLLEQVQSFEATPIPTSTAPR